MALYDLNSSIAKLPPTVSYISIIGTGELTVGVNPYPYEDGDGIVSYTSQNLDSVPGKIVLQQKTTRLDIGFLPECGHKSSDYIPGKEVGETHTCETSDRGVWAEILRDLR
jgi:hypothetical protein